MRQTLEGLPDRAPGGRAAGRSDRFSNVVQTPSIFFFDDALSGGRKEVPWSLMACLHTLARFCEPSSDLAVAESFYPKTALEDLLGVRAEKIYDNRLYRALDAILPCRRALFSHLKTVYGELFGTSFDILLYDITSTYFEGQAGSNAKAKRGYSRDSRPDCEQVCIGLVVTPEQLPLAYEVFAGNRTDVTTIEEIFDLMEATYGRARRVWVMDRGMVSEDNLAILRGRGASYLVGTPRSMLKRCQQDLPAGSWDEVQPGVKVKEVFLPADEEDPGARERFLLCRSRQRAEKDRAIVESRLPVGGGIDRSPGADQGRARTVPATGGTPHRSPARAV